MIVLSAVDGYNSEASNYSNLKDVAWTGLPTALPHYVERSALRFDIAYNYDMYSGYQRAKLQSLEVPALVRSEFGEAVYQRNLLRLNGEH